MRKVSQSSIPSRSTSKSDSASSSSEVSSSDATSKAKSPPSAPAPSDKSAPVPAALTEEQAKKQKAAKHLSRQMPAMDLKSRLHGQIAVSSSSTPQTDHAKLQKTKAVSDFQLDAIGKKYGPDVAKDLEQVMDSLKVDYPKLKKDPKPQGDAGFAHKEKLQQFAALESRLKSDPAAMDYFAREIAANRKDQMYQHLGPAKFCGMLADVDKNIKEGKDGKPLPTFQWSTMEKVAAYGYTTQDYRAINMAMRKDKGQPADPGLAAYATHARNAMAQMPDYAGKNPAKPEVFRAISKPLPDSPQWMKDNWDSLKFKKGKEYMDFSFASHSAENNVRGDFVLVAGTKNAKNLGPYSAWKGEEEILVLPGTRYKIDDIDEPKDKKAAKTVWLKAV